MMVVDVDGRPEEPGSELVHCVDRLLERSERRIVLNLRLRAANSSCLGEAVICHLNARKVGAQIKLAVADPKTVEAIQTLRLNRVLDCYASEEEALRSFSV